MFLLWLLVLVPPLYFATSAKDPFRLPKLMLAEWLALGSLVPLAWVLRRVETLHWRELWRQPAIRAVLPFAAVATAGLAFTLHPLHVREALADLWIGAACLIGWSAALPAGRLERLLGGLLWPAVALAAIGILQFHGLQPLPVAPHPGGSRYAVTSTAGNPGDLAAFLVLPCLIAQWRLAQGAAAPRPVPRERGAQRGGGNGGNGGNGPSQGNRGWLVAALAVCAYCIALTQTFAALLALLLGSVTLWIGVRRRDAAGWRRLSLAIAAVAVLAAGVVAGLPALRSRAMEKARLVRQGDWNAVLTGRLDGWRAAAWMLGEHPWAGVGHGAFRAEFAPAKLALIERGVAFHSGQQQNFVNAHDEPLEVAADSGVPGLLALAWALGVLAVAVRARLAQAAASEPGERGGDTLERRGRAAGAFAAAGLAALGVLSLVDFPFRVALVAFPAMLFFAWVLRPAAGEAAA